VAQFEQKLVSEWSKASDSRQASYQGIASAMPTSAKAPPALAAEATEAGLPLKPSPIRTALFKPRQAPQMMPACEPSLVSGHRFSDADTGEGTAGFSR